jgi:uncharacterized protein (TIGR03067 family)
MTSQLIVAAVVLVAAEAPTEDAAKKNLKKMEGTWMLIGHVHEGKTTTEKENKQARVKLIIKGDKYSIYFGAKEAGKGTIRLDPAKKPKEIDLILAGKDSKGQVMLGIYELKDDVLKVCNAVPGKARPEEFSAKKGSRRYLITYKRLKP